MAWNPFKTNNNSNQSKEPQKIEIEHKSKLMEESFYDKIQKDKKNLLPTNSMTREEIIKEIEKQYIKQSMKNDNPFKTRDDVYYCFYNSNMELSRPPVPFEEVIIAGKKFFINKKFENGKIIIEEMYPSPDVEIDLKNEFDKKETTKGQLEKINKYILYIKDQIAKGEKNFELIDTDDLKEEKHRLERILSSIKYGKSAIFKFQNPINLKPAYMMKYCNGEFKYLKVTEHNYITEENSVKAIKGQTILKKVEDIINLRITKSWKDILLSLMAIIVFVALIFGAWKMATFQEELFDKRVQTYCGDNILAYKNELINMKDYKCALVGINSTGLMNPQTPGGYNVAK